MQEKERRDTHRVSETRKKDIFIVLSQKKSKVHLNRSTNTQMCACADAREDERLLESFTEQQRGGFVPLDWKLDDGPKEPPVLTSALKSRIGEWRKITVDKFILAIIMWGYRIEWDPEERPTSPLRHEKP